MSRMVGLAPGAAIDGILGGGGGGTGFVMCMEERLMARRSAWVSYSVRPCSGAVSDDDSEAL